MALEIRSALRGKPNLVSGVAAAAAAAVEEAARGACPSAVSVTELQDFIGLKCAHIGPALVAKLVDAATTTLVRMKALGAFRDTCFYTKEDHGRLYDLVKQIAAPPPTSHMLCSNPYAEFIARFPAACLPKELDFLTGSYILQGVKCNMNIDLGLTDEEARRLEHALTTKLIPEWLIKPCSFLTFEENLDLRVQVSRLWIAGSKLPIYVGSSMNFEELSRMSRAPEEPADATLEENLPSKFQVRMRENTIDALYWVKTEGWTLLHPAPEELPSHCLSFKKCYANVRYPVTIDDEGWPSWGVSTTDEEVNRIEFEDTMDADLYGFKANETPRMYKRLAKLIYGVEV